MNKSGLEFGVGPTNFSTAFQALPRFAKLVGEEVQYYLPGFAPRGKKGVYKKIWYGDPLNPMGLLLLRENLARTIWREGKSDYKLAPVWGRLHRLSPEDFELMERTSFRRSERGRHFSWATAKESTTWGSIYGSDDESYLHWDIRELRPEYPLPGLKLVSIATTNNFVDKNVYDSRPRFPGDIRGLRVDVGMLQPGELAGLYKSVSDRFRGAEYDYPDIVLR